MDMTGENRIEAPRAAVWAALNDAEVLRQSIPGCESMEKLSDSEYTAKVLAKIGPIKARFTSRILISDAEAPVRYTINGEGQGGVAGFAKGKVEVVLEEAEAGATLLRYVVKASVGGKLAQLGSRLIDATARKMAAEFFQRFGAVVTGAPLPGAAAEEGGEGAGG